MGTDYEILDRKNKRRLDLGRGWWKDVYDKDPKVFETKDSVTRYVVDCYAFSETGRVITFSASHCLKKSDLIWAFVKDVPRNQLAVVYDYQAYDEGEDWPSESADLPTAHEGGMEAVILHAEEAIKAWRL